MSEREREMGGDVLHEEACILRLKMVMRGGDGGGGVRDEGTIPQ